MAVTNGYCTLAQLKAALRISDSTDDALLEASIESASRLVDGHCARAFWNAGTATRQYAANDQYSLEVDDFHSSTITIQTASSDYGVYDTTWVQSRDAQLEPINGVIDGLSWPYNKIRAVGDYSFPVAGGGREVRVRITAVFGWSAVPKTIEQATLIQASRIFKRADSPLGVAGFGEFGAMRVSTRLDPDVAMLVDPYRRVRNVA